MHHLMSPTCLELVSPVQSSNAGAERSEASEALALWRGVEAAAAGGPPLLQLCGTLDVAPSAGAAPAAQQLLLMEEACQAAGLDCSVLSGGAAAERLPPLRLPRGAAALHAPMGGVLRGGAAAAALRGLAARTGADVLPAPGRALLSWRDRGSFFELRTCTAAPPAGRAPRGPGPLAWEGEVIIEAEQLAVLPEAGDQALALALLGLSLPGVHVRAPAAAVLAAGPELAAAPAWQLLGLPGTEDGRDPGETRCWGTPALDWRPGRLTVGQALEDAPLLEAERLPASEEEEGERGAHASAGSREPSSGEEAEQAAAASLHAPALARALWRGVGGAAGGAAASLRICVTPDGEPVLGGHPGLEEGRALVCLPGAAAAAWLAPDGRQLAPLLAQLAADALLGRPLVSVDAARVALGRQALGLAIREGGLDSWDPAAVAALAARFPR